MKVSEILERENHGTWINLGLCRRLLYTARQPADKKPAECVLFSTGQLGEPAVSAFNEFAAGTQTKQIPALLLLGPNHHEWKAKAKLDLAPHQRVLSMPIAIKDLLDTVARLLPSVPAV